ncbi:MAG: hypothetical protein P4L64_06875 [Caulobacteraceae bacterium]|nr:hypothetical protein [Caulobacteraceae bacterium]
MIDPLVTLAMAGFVFATALVLLGRIIPDNYDRAASARRKASPQRRIG